MRRTSPSRSGRPTASGSRSRCGATTRSSGGCNKASRQRDQLRSRRRRKNVRELTLVVLRSAFERVNEERSNDERLHYRRMLNPDSTLTRTPALDGTTATLTGTFITPHLNV